MSVLDAVQLEGVDLTADVPCSMADCGAAAVWTGHVLCPVCPVSWYPECAKHKVEIQKRVARPALRICNLHPTVRIPAPFIEWRLL